MKEKESPSKRQGEPERQHDPDRLLPRWVVEFANELRDEAERRKSLWPDDPLVSALPEIARQLEDRARAYALQSLSVSQASEESGFSEDHLYRMIKSNRIEDVGTGSSRRIRRADLPRKGSNSGATGGLKDEVGEFMRGLE